MSQSVEKHASLPSSDNDEKGTAVKTQVEPLDFAERRRRALAEIDNAKFSWFHVKVALIAGVGFFTDALVLPFDLLSSLFTIQPLSLVMISSPSTSPPS